MSVDELIVEDATVEYFGKLGYFIGHGANHAHDEPATERVSVGKVVPVGRLYEASRRLNHAFAEEALRVMP